MDLRLRAIELSPERAHIRLRVAMFGHRFGVMPREEVEQMLIRWAELSGVDNPERMPVLLEAEHDDAARPEAMALIRELDESGHASGHQLADLYILLEEHELAIRMIERAYRDREPQMVELGVDPQIPEEIRRDERIVRILDEMGLPNGIAQ